MMAGTSWILHENSAYFELLQPLFEEALKHSDITARVGCDDAVAIMAWSYLRSKGIEVPGRISLMGFGNTLDSVKTDVTSYDFDYSATAASMVNFLLRPSWAARFRTLARPRIDGAVIQRGSTAAPTDRF